MRATSFTSLQIITKNLTSMESHPLTWEPHTMDTPRDTVKWLYNLQLQYDSDKHNL